jgi:alkylation response protein AidB-like acyl-CoA dehydrogenase
MDLTLDERRNAQLSIGMTVLPSLRREAGIDLDLVSAVLAMEELGSAAYNGALLETIGMVAAVEQTGCGDVRSITDRLSSGKAIGSLALLDDPSDPCVAEGTGSAPSQRRISGTKMVVRDGDLADLVLCTAQSPDNVAMVLLVEPTTCGDAIAIDDLPALDGHLPTVTFHQAQAWVLAENDAAVDLKIELRKITSLLACSEMVGIVRALLERSVTYSNVRHQFGRPIGSFQALQHALVDVALVLDAGRLLTWQAAWSIAGNHDSPAALAVAQSWLAQGSRSAYAKAHQVHGARGFTWGEGLHCYTRRAKAIEALFWDDMRATEQVLEAADLDGETV